MKANSLQVTWKGGINYELNKQQRETFRGIKSAEAAEAILSKLNAVNIQTATWHDTAGETHYIK